MWGRVPPKIWLVVYPIAVIALLLSMKLVQAPAEAWIKQRVENEFGTPMEEAWEFPYTGKIVGLEPADDGFAVLYFEEQDKLVFEKYDLQGKMQHQEKLKNPGGQEGWLVHQNDGYIVNSPGFVAKFSFDGELEWYTGQAEIPTDFVSISTAAHAVGVVATSIGLTGIDCTGKPAWRGKETSVPPFRTDFGLGMGEKLLRCPTGQFILVHRSSNQSRTDYMLYTNTGDGQCHAWFEESRLINYVPLASGGLLAYPDFPIFDPTFTSKMFWGGPAGQARFETAAGLVKATAPDPQGKIHLILDQYDKRQHPSNLIPSLVTEFDADGNRTHQFEIPGMVLGLAYGEDGLLYWLWQIEPDTSRSVILFTCMDRQGTEIWRSKIADIDKGRKIEISSMRVTADRLFIVSRSRSSVESGMIFCYLLPDC